MLQRNIVIQQTILYLRADTACKGTLSIMPDIVLWSDISDNLLKCIWILGMLRPSANSCGFVWIVSTEIKFTKDLHFVFYYLTCNPIISTYASDKADRCQADIFDIGRYWLAESAKTSPRLKVPISRPRDPWDGIDCTPDWPTAWVWSCFCQRTRSSCRQGPARADCQT